MHYDAAISSPLITCPNILQSRWWLFINLRWLDVWNRCRIGQTGRPFALLRALGLECVIIGVWSIMLWGRNLTSSVVQIHHIIMAIMALHWSSLVECMQRVLCWPWMNSAYVVLLCVCVCACIRLCYQWLLHYEVAILPSCAILLSDGNGGSSSTFVCWIYGPTGVVLAVTQQLVCFHCCVWAWTWTRQWFSMQYVWGRNFTFDMWCSKCTTMAMTTLRWSLFFECMERVLALNEQRVRFCTSKFVVGVLEFDGIIVDWCSLRSLSHLFIHCTGNDVSCFIMAISTLRSFWFDECMTRVLCWPWMNSAYVALLCVSLH